MKSWAAAAVVLFCAGCGGDADPAFIRGAWLAEHGGKGLLTSEARTRLGRMRDIGVEWIAVGPEVHMPDIHAPEIAFDEENGDLRRYLRVVRSAGFEIMLLPRIESPAFFKPPHPFRADIEMRTPEQWEAFHDQYERMLLHYARLAEEEGVGIFCLGLEYRKAVNADPARWARMADRVREVFSGKLTYSANWWKEYEEVRFWSSLDFIGIGAYFQILEQPGGGPDELADGWRPHVEHLAAFSRSVGRPILFTETGYTAYADAGRFPWKWQFETDRPVDLEHQAACFEALFGALTRETWFAGLFIWRFYTDNTYVKEWEYTPEGRPAEAVIRRWYRRS